MRRGSRLACRPTGATACRPIPEEERLPVSFWKRLFDRPPSPGAGSGRGGALGTPSFSLDESSPSIDQEANAVVSGGGLTGPDDVSGPHGAAEQSPSAQAP